MEQNTEFKGFIKSSKIIVVKIKNYLKNVLTNKFVIDIK